MTPAQVLRHNKYELTAAQKSFAEHPSASNWRKVLFHMECYQMLFNKSLQKKEAHA